MPGSSRKAAMQHLAGDVPSPWGGGELGVQNTQYLNRGKQEVGVIFRGRSDSFNRAILTVDVYAIPGEPLKVHLICPKCSHQLTIDGHKKPIEWAPNSPSPIASELRSDLGPDMQYLAANLGVLTIEPFTCTWELEDKMRGNQDVGVISGMARCNFRGAITKNILREV